MSNYKITFEKSGQECPSCPNTGLHNVHSEQFPLKYNRYCSQIPFPSKIYFYRTMEKVIREKKTPKKQHNFTLPHVQIKKAIAL